jgi:flagellar basal body-associated protein FliL
MAEEKEVKQPDQAANNSSEGGSNKIMFFGILAGVLILNTAIAFVLIKTTVPKAPKAEESEQADTTVQQSRATSLGAISDPPVEAIVNVAGTDGMRFLKVTVVFEYDDKKYKDLGAELARRQPQLKDLLLDKLSNMTLEELRDARAKDRIRQDLIRMVNDALPEDAGEIRDVFFNDFIMQ